MMAVYMEDNMELSYFKIVQIRLTMGNYFTGAYISGIATAIFGYIVSFVSPILPFVFFVIAITWFDSVLGIRVANRKEEKVSTNGRFRTVEKTLIYLGFLVVAEWANNVLVQGYFPDIHAPFSYIVAFVIARHELLSAAGKGEQLTGVKFKSFIGDWFKTKTNGLFNNKTKQK